MTGPVVAALGGGHGLAATLTALRYVTDEITAIVTVADDGGSSGRLRDEFGVLPPGDLRMALAALQEAVKVTGAAPAISVVPPSIVTMLVVLASPNAASVPRRTAPWMM